jgi:hypothetical protein
LLDKEKKWYHIIPRGNNKQAIFFCDDDYLFHKKQGPYGRKDLKAALPRWIIILLACCRYIETNPIRAGLVADLKDYRWSSYPGKIGIRKDDLLDLDVWCESLGSTEREYS